MLKVLWTSSTRTAVLIPRVPGLWRNHQRNQQHPRPQQQRRHHWVRSRCIVAPRQTLAPTPFPPPSNLPSRFSTAPSSCRTSMLMLPRAIYRFADRAPLRKVQHYQTRQPTETAVLPSTSRAIRLQPLHIKTVYGTALAQPSLYYQPPWHPSFQHPTTESLRRVHHVGCNRHGR